MFDNLFEIVYSDDVWTPVHARPLDDVTLEPLSEWWQGITYPRSGGSDWTDQARIVKASKNELSCLVIEMKIWHGGFHSGDEWTDYLSLR